MVPERDAVAGRRGDRAGRLRADLRRAAHRRLHLGRTARRAQHRVERNDRRRLAAPSRPPGRPPASRYLNGTVPVDDREPAVRRVVRGARHRRRGRRLHPARHRRRHPAVPAPARWPASTSTTAARNWSSPAPLNRYQTHGLVLGHGLVNWLTKGVHLGHWRNWFSLHVDDVLLPDDRWHTAGQLHRRRGLPGRALTAAADPDGAGRRRRARRLAEAAPASSSTSPTTPAAASSARRRRPADRAAAGPQGRVALAQPHLQPPVPGLRARTSPVTPWRCATDPASGATRYVSTADDHRARSPRTSTGPGARASTSTSGNWSPASTPGCGRCRRCRPTTRTWPRRCTAGGRHGTSPRTPRASRGRARSGRRDTVPRHPMNIFYNVGHGRRRGRRVQLDLHAAGRRRQRDLREQPEPRRASRRWAPNGFSNYIVPMEARIAFDHVVSGRPRVRTTRTSRTSPRTGSSTRCSTPLLARYKATFTTATPLVNPRIAGGRPADAPAGAVARGRRRPHGHRVPARRHGDDRQQRTGGDGRAGDRADRHPQDRARTCSASRSSAARSARLRRAALGLAGAGEVQRDAHGEAAGMRIALINEGTYPYVAGGVSTWCDQLVRGLPDVRWHLVSIVAGDHPTGRRRRCRPPWTRCSRCRCGAPSGPPATRPSGPRRGCAGACSATARPTWPCSPKGCGSWRSRRCAPRRWFRRRRRRAGAAGLGRHPLAGVPLADDPARRLGGQPGAAPADAARRRRRRRAAGARGAPARRPAAGGGPVPRQRQRARRAGRAGREVARRRAVRC